MFKNAICALSMAISGYGLIAFSAPASAACGNDIWGWECLNVDGTDYTDAGPQGPLYYEGPWTLEHWSVGPLYCTLTAEVVLEVNSSSNAAQLTITDLTSSSPDCQSLSYDNLPLVYDFRFDDPYPKYSDSVAATSNGTLNIDHTTFANICDDHVTLTFDNDGLGGSWLDFSQTMSGYFGSCSIEGMVSNWYVEAY